MGEKADMGEHEQEKREESLADVVKSVSNDVCDAWRRHGDMRSFIGHACAAAADKNSRFASAVWRAPADVWSWSREGAAWRAIVAGSVAAVIVSAALGVATFLVVLTATVINAVFVAFLLTLWGISALLAVFLAAIAALCVGAIATAAAIISFITFCVISFIFIFSACLLCTWAAWSAARSIFRRVFTTSVVGKEVKFGEDGAPKAPAQYLVEEKESSS